MLNFTSRFTCRSNYRAPKVKISNKRFLNLQEYQSKQLMDNFGVRTQKWILAKSSKEGETLAAQNLNAKELVVKAQILAGGRGKGFFDNGFKGGVHLCNTAKEAGELVGKMIGHNLITAQTSSEGVPVKKVIDSRGHRYKKGIILVYFNGQGPRRSCLCWFSKRRYEY